MKMHSIEVLLAAVLLASCGAAPVLDQTGGDPVDGESIVVMKVDPPDFKPFFFPGQVKDGKFTDVGLNARIAAAPMEGYIVVRARSGETLGLTSISRMNKAIAFMGRPYEVCEGAHAMVFEVPSGRVVYLADLEYEEVTGGLNFRHTRNLASAAAHLRKNFPAVSREVELQPWQFLPVTTACEGGRITVTTVPAR